MKKITVEKGEAVQRKVIKLGTVKKSQVQGILVGKGQVVQYKVI